MADFAVQYMTNHANAKPYVTKILVRLKEVEENLVTYSAVPKINSDKTQPVIAGAHSTVNVWFLQGWDFALWLPS